MDSPIEKKKSLILILWFVVMNVSLLGSYEKFSIPTLLFSRSQVVASVSFGATTMELFPLETPPPTTIFKFS
jgi:hypothetical protein